METEGLKDARQNQGAVAPPGKKEGGRRRRAAVSRCRTNEKKTEIIGGGGMRTRQCAADSCEFGFLFARNTSEWLVESIMANGTLLSAACL